jgi:osmotically-inducible protein OsmY
MRRPVAVLALTLIVPCSLKRSDDAIAAGVKAQLYSDQQVQGTFPAVSISKRVVTLFGTLPCSRKSRRSVSYRSSCSGGIE